MRRPQKRPFETPLWDNPSLSPLDRIRLLDDFTLGQERLLSIRSKAMFNYMIDPQCWSQEQYNAALAEEMARNDTTTVLDTFDSMSSHSTPENPRASKRQARVRPASSEGFARPNITNQNPTFAPFTPFYQSLSGQPYEGGLGQQAPNLDPMQFESQEPGTPDHHTESATTMSTANSFNNYGPSFPTGFGPLVPDHQPSTVAPQVSQRQGSVSSSVGNHNPGSSAPPRALGTASAPSAHGSTDSISHNRTIFTQPQSSAQTFSFVESSSQPGTAANNTSISHESRLMGNPMKITLGHRARQLSDDRHHKTWENWELNDMMNFYVGPGASDEHCLVAVTTPLSPKTTDPPLANEWTILSTNHFNGKRTPLTLARKWWSLIDTFALIIAMFASPVHDSLTDILERVSRAIHNPDFIALPTLGVLDLIAWSEGGANGWFGLIYNRIAKHKNITDRIAIARLTLLPTSLRSVVRLPRRAKSTRSGSSVEQSAFSQSMPPPPPISRPGSGRPLSLLSETSADNTPAPVVPPNAPTAAEMVRNHTAITAAEVKMALAKAEYIQAYADLERFKLYERFVTLKFSAREQARQTAHEVLNLAVCPDAMRLRAEDIFMQQMTSSLPRVDIREILEQLQQGLPSLDELGIDQPVDPVIPQAPSPPPGARIPGAETSQGAAPPNSPTGASASIRSVW